MQYGLCSIHIGLERLFGLERVDSSNRFGYGMQNNERGYIVQVSRREKF